MIKIGSFVMSNQGRDKDNIYIVKNILLKNVQLVDGNGKTLDKPKTKNIKHVNDLNEICEKIANKFKTNQKVFDAEIYSAIKKFKEN